MKATLFGILLSIAAFSCREQNRNEVEKFNIQKESASITQNVVESLWGNSIKVDSSNAFELAIYYLNRSMYKNAVGALKTKFILDTINTGGFYGFKLANNFEVSNYERYILFRLNEYLGNLSENELNIQLVKSVVDPKNELYVLQTIEYKYLQNKKQRSIDVDKKYINELKDASIRFPNSKRIKFLLANEYLAVNNTKEALKLFDNLIQDNYYALLSIRAITQFLSYNKSPLYNKYFLLFQEKFPNECNLSNLKISWKAIPEDSLNSLCLPCIKSDFQKDSILSRLYLAKSYLNKRQFGKVDSIINDFNNNYDAFVLDSTLLFERGLYSDFKIRSLFLQQKYNEICEFVKNNLGYNPVIKIDNKEELKIYIQHLYNEYDSSIHPNNFDFFFNEKFNGY